MKVEEKIYSLNSLAKKIEELKSTEQKIILCHGTFDLLHPGHLRYFQEAKKLGDILVVTLTPDRFVNKGEGRPIYNEDLRAEFIASIFYVNYVAINENPDAIDLIKKLKPDVYCKGQDYKNHSDDPTGKIIEEVNAIESIGGIVHYTNDIRFSSSQLIYKNFQQELDAKKRSYDKNFTPPF